MNIHHDTMLAFGSRRFVASEVEQPPQHASRVCTHQFVVRLKETTNGRKQARRQCVRCGMGSGNFVSIAGVTELWDHELERRNDEIYEDLRRAYWRDREAMRDAENEEWWQVYTEYLRSPVWRAKRNAVMMRAKSRCECCEVNSAVQVHHTQYPKVLGHEPLWTLRAVCLRCHQLLHPHRDFNA